MTDLATEASPLLEFEYANRILRIRWSTPNRIASHRLNSRGLVGLVGYLVFRRLHDPDDAVVSASEFHAFAPGWETVKTTEAVGKRFHKLFTEHSCLVPIFVPEEGTQCGGPWRISVPPSSIRVLDIDVLERYVASRAGNASTKAMVARVAPNRCLEHDLKRIEQELTSGQCVESRTEFIRARLRGAERVASLSIKVEAFRLRSLQFFDACEVDEAQTAINHAIQIIEDRFRPAGSVGLEETAAAYITSAMINHRRRRLSDANSALLRANMILQAIGEPTARTQRLCVECLLIRSQLAVLEGKLDEGLAVLRQARQIASSSTQHELALATCVEEAVLIVSQGATSRTLLEMKRRLATVLLLSSATNPKGILGVKRALLMTLYALGRFERGDRLARAILDDANRLNLAREHEEIQGVIQKYQREPFVDETRHEPIRVPDLKAALRARSLPRTVVHCLFSRRDKPRIIRDDSSMFSLTQSRSVISWPVFGPRPLPNDHALLLRQQPCVAWLRSEEDTWQSNAKEKSVSLNQGHVGRRKPELRPPLPH